MTAGPHKIVFDLRIFCPEFALRFFIGNEVRRIHVTAIDQLVVFDRLLAGVKVAAGKKKPLVPRSDAAVRALVAIRAERWNTREEGWTEVDTVAHCGGDMGGSFIWSLTSVEILSGWTEVRAVCNREQLSADRHRWIEQRPFAMKARIEKLLEQIWTQRSQLLEAEDGQEGRAIFDSLRSAPGGQKSPPKQPKTENYGVLIMRQWKPAL